MHIIIIGGGDIGYPLSKALAAQHDIFLVDPDPLRGDRFAPLDVEFVHGSGTSPDVLRRAGADRCDLLIAATRLDEVNIVACSIGNQLGARETICFVTKEDFLRPPGRIDSLREHFGIDHVIWPEAQLAGAIERIIMAPGAVDAEVFAGGRIQLLEFRLEADSAFVNHTVSSLDLPHGVVIVVIKHEDSISIPRGPTRLTLGDKVVLMGTREAMDQLRGKVSPGSDEAASQLVTIIGGGDVGYQLAQHLERADGIKLRVIERERARGEMLAETLGNALILRGDGTDLELLESEEIGRSDVLVSVIDNDERNLLACLLGRQLGVRKVITRVSKPANLRLFERVGIDVALSARAARGDVGRAPDRRRAGQSAGHPRGRPRPRRRADGPGRLSGDRGQGSEPAGRVDHRVDSSRGRRARAERRGSRGGRRPPAGLLHRHRRPSAP